VLVSELSFDEVVWALSPIIVSTLPDLIVVLYAQQDFNINSIYKGILAGLSVAVNHTGLALLLYDFELHGTWGPGNSISSLSKWNGGCRNQSCS